MGSAETPVDALGALTDWVGGRPVMRCSMQSGGQGKFS